MKARLNCILLIDDNESDNYYHKIIIEGMNIAGKIEIAENGLEALTLLKKEKQTPPELIFLDINMPKMDGWEFLEKYKDLDIKQKARITIVMLTTSSNPEDRKRAEKAAEVSGFVTKPLSEEILNGILEAHFK
jgi:CheY-like chemotaxis protein